ncbi:class I SAM-dependent methyltransferase [Clostridium sp. KNHs216]|uniref:class I SAM-dependent methyltransferase n=1 Tax=Clostridium sp. KNHs216 TaxID=1550235 RepID=UPI001153E620|nr:class I SAM-dependent methyltransferase [Clostridium sp. KNHs216]TQI68123.1 methyltransferase family protein [Clostridium sp. KNHs216]
MGEIPNSMLFQSKADQYVLGRPGYPQEVFDLIASVVPPSENIRIADIGSGTGIFSEELLKRNYETDCVEASEAMRRKAEAGLCRYGGFHSVGAPAEDTGLPDNSLDLITVASAFHWFNTPKFLAECRRILKKDGWVFIVTNARPYDDEFTKAHHEICRRFCPSFTGVNHGAEYVESVLPDFFTAGYTKKIIPHDLVYTNEQFLSRCISSSFSPNPGDAGYPAYCDELKELTSRFSADGKILVHNQTVVWFGRIRRS